MQSHIGGGKKGLVVVGVDHLHPAKAEPCILLIKSKVDTSIVR